MRPEQQFTTTDYNIWLMTTVGHDIVIMNAFHSLIQRWWYNDGCCMRCRKCLP